MIRNFCVAFGVLLLAGCVNINKVLKSSDYNYKLQKADEFYAQKKYNHAQVIYEDVFPAIKGTDKYEDVYYKWAYCNYYQKDYLNAENIFKGYVENFPNSKRAEECEYMRAYCFYKQSPKVDLDQTNSFKAMTYLQTFINTHPGSPRTKEAADIIEDLRYKLELKDFKAADLYYKLGYWKSAATTFTTLVNDYPDSKKTDEYKLMVIKSWFEYARFSVEEKQPARYEQVLNECADFSDRFPESKLQAEVDKYKNLSQNYLKQAKNEQAKAST